MALDKINKDIENYLAEIERVDRLHHEQKFDLKEHNKEIERLEKKIERVDKPRINPLMGVLLIALIASGIFFIKPAMTGFIVLDESSVAVDKETYHLGETVHISLTYPENYSHSISIIKDGTASLIESLEYLPEQQGSYELNALIYNENESIRVTTAFNVIESPTENLTENLTEIAEPENITSEVIKEAEVTNIAEEPDDECSLMLIDYNGESLADDKRNKNPRNITCQVSRKDNITGKLHIKESTNLIGEVDGYVNSTWYLSFNQSEDYIEAASIIIDYWTSDSYLNLSVKIYSNSSWLEVCKLPITNRTFQTISCNLSSYIAGNESEIFTRIDATSLKKPGHEEHETETNSIKFDLILLNATLSKVDKIPPATITNLTEGAIGSTWILWNWTNPADSDLNHVEIWINGTFYANVSSPINYYNATGLMPSTTYEIQIRTVDNRGNVNVTSINYTVQTMPAEGTVNFKEDVNDALGRKVTVKIDVLNQTDQGIVYSNYGTTHRTTIPKGTYDIRVLPENNAIKQIIFRGVPLEKDLDQLVDIDDPAYISDDNRLIIFNEIYAVNPQITNFKYAEVSVTAKGDYLYKCAFWDFKARDCKGSWMKYMDITPGENYTVIMTATDPAFGEGSDVFTLTNITIDGNMSDWDAVLQNENNYIMDGTSGIDDLDTGQTADRDLRQFAFTWNDQQLFFYFRRTSAGDRQVSVLVYVDRDADGYMNSTDKVLKFIWKGGAGTYSSHIYDYVPSGTADILTGDGVDMPGTVANEIVLENNILGGTSPGIMLETRVNWTTLNLTAGTPIKMHISSAIGDAGTLPAAIEDNMQPVYTLVVDLSFTKDEMGGVAQNSSIRYKHTITNLGNKADVFDINYSGIRENWTVTFYYANGTNLTDTDSDGIIDTGSLAPGRSVNITVEFFIPASEINGVTDMTTLIATSSLKPTISASLTDRTSVGTVTIMPSAIAGNMARGALITYNHTIKNNQLNTDVIEVNASSTQGWQVYLKYANGTSLTDTDGDSMVDVGNLSHGEEKNLIVQIQIPDAASIGTIDITTINVSSSLNSANYMIATDTTTASDRVTIVPNRTGIAGIGSYIYYTHEVSNNWNQVDTFDISYNSSQNWTATFYEADGVTLLTDTDGDSKIDTGAIGLNGESKIIKVKITIPDNIPVHTVDLTDITVTSSLNTSVYATARDNTTAQILVTYNNSGRTSSQIYFRQNTTVYSRGYDVSVANAYYVWIDSNGTIKRISPDIAVDAERNADDSYAINITDLSGTWTVILYNAQNDAEITREYFYVNTEPIIHSINATPSSLYQGQSINISANVTDETNVSTVWVVINSTIYNMTRPNSTTGSGIWYFDGSNTSSYPAGTYNYTVYANDTFTFYNSAVPKTGNFTILSSLPVIWWINDTPDPVQQGQTINFTANVTDNIAVDKVWIGINGINYTMNYSGNNIYYYDTFNTNIAAATYNYTVYANDTEGYSAVPMTGNFTIQGMMVSMINITNITIAPDDDNVTAGTQINPLESSNVTVNLTANITNSSAIDKCFIYLYAPNGSSIFNLTGTVAGYGNYSLCEATWQMEYWRAAGSWNASVFANTTDSYSDSDYAAFYYNELRAMEISSYTITFSGEPGITVNSTEAYPLYINNTGNVNLNLSISGADFIGQTNISYVVGVGNATYNNTDTGAFSSLTTAFNGFFNQLIPATNTTLYLRGILPYTNAQIYQANISIKGE